MKLALIYTVLSVAILVSESAPDPKKCHEGPQRGGCCKKGVMCPALSSSTSQSLTTSSQSSASSASSTSSSSSSLCSSSSSSGIAKGQCSIGSASESSKLLAQSAASSSAASSESSTSLSASGDCAEIVDVASCSASETTDCESESSTSSQASTCDKDRSGGGSGSCGGGCKTLCRKFIHDLLTAAKRFANSIQQFCDEMQKDIGDLLQIILAAIAKCEAQKKLLEIIFAALGRACSIAAELNKCLKMWTSAWEKICVLLDKSNSNFVSLNKLSGNLVMQLANLLKKGNHNQQLVDQLTASVSKMKKVIVLLNELSVNDKKTECTQKEITNLSQEEETINKSIFKQFEQLQTTRKKMCAKHQEVAEHHSNSKAIQKSINDLFCMSDEQANMLDNLSKSMTVMTKETEIMLGISKDVEKSICKEIEELKCAVATCKTINVGTCNRLLGQLTQQIELAKINTKKADCNCIKTKLGAMRDMVEDASAMLNKTDNNGKNEIKYIFSVSDKVFTYCCPCQKNNSQSCDGNPAPPCGNSPCDGNPAPPCENSPCDGNPAPSCINKPGRGNPHCENKHKRC